MRAILRSLRRRFRLMPSQPMDNCSAAVSQSSTLPSQNIHAGTPAGACRQKNTAVIDAKPSNCGSSSASTHARRFLLRQAIRKASRLSLLIGLAIILLGQFATNTALQIALLTADLALFICMVRILVLRRALALLER